MTNPLLTLTELPAFQQIKPEYVEPALDQILADNRAQIPQLLMHKQTYTWENLVQPLDELEDRLNQMWSPVNHLNAVVNTPELREAYNQCLPKLTEYATELGQNEQLYKAFLSIAESQAYHHLTIAQKKVIDNAVRDFRLSGVALEPAAKKRFSELKQQLAKLKSQFEENVLDATDAWTRHVTNPDELTGLPEHARIAANEAAQQKNLAGWLFTLQYPSYSAVITYADNRQLREEMYTAYVTRASDQGPNTGRWDNSKVMEQILQLRHEVAQLLGYKSYAELSLVTKMAPSPQKVMDFLNDLARRTKPMAMEEFRELQEFAKTHGIEQLQAWDMAYYSEKLCQHKYAISQEELRPYFPEERVINGMFETVKRLFGITITENKCNIETWHPDVHFYDIHDASGNLRGRFYLDLYARPQKRGGAWMDECRTRYIKSNGCLQTPVAYLTCNFSRPTADKPALFTHDEVITLFHEFGHGLQHMLTQVDYAGVSGINGVAWDAVELPSQFMENWCWEREALQLISEHYATKEPLPDALFNKMLAAKNFQSGLQMLRQLEFALFDFRLHLEYDPRQGAKVQQVLDEVRNTVSIIKPPAFNRFQHGFTHIFAGGYAAGYYSYKWAEVLSSDAFSKFEENGIFDRATGQSFMRTILEQGGSREPMELFVEFRGREPQIDALLRHSGISE